MDPSRRRRALSIACCAATASLLAKMEPASPAPGPCEMSPTSSRPSPDGAVPGSCWFRCSYRVLRSLNVSTYVTESNTCS